MIGFYGGEGTLETEGKKLYVPHSRMGKVHYQGESGAFKKLSKKKNSVGANAHCETLASNYGRRLILHTEGFFAEEREEVLPVGGSYLGTEKGELIGASKTRITFSARRGKKTQDPARVWEGCAQKYRRGVFQSFAKK